MMQISVKFYFGTFYPGRRPASAKLPTQRAARLEILGDVEI